MKKVVDIGWETDGADVQLPNEMEIPDNIDYSDDEAIFKYLSDKVGVLALCYTKEND